MEQIDLLWDLQSQYNSLNDFENELLGLKGDLNIKRANKKISEAEKKFEKSKLENEDAKTKLIELERSLRDYNYDFEVLEKSLYDGHTTDIQQLEYLSSEKDKFKEIINNLEVEVLEWIDKSEKTEKEFLLMENCLKDIKNNNGKIKKTTQEQTEEIKIKIEEQKQQIMLFENKIDKALLNTYTKIKKNRGTGIVEVKDFACPICNIRIPTFAADKLKNTKDIVNCESCGRILYYIPIEM